MHDDSVTFAGRTYTLDRHGFLDPPEQWDRNFAEGMARLLGIQGGLTHQHWQVISYLRRKFLEEKTVPVMVAACSDTNKRLSEFRALFPTGYHRGACKIAGINYQFMYESNYWLTYETAPPAAVRYDLDQLGFLKEFRQWDEDFPEFVVNELRLRGTITDAHRIILRYLREYYKTYGTIPTVYETCTSNGLSLADLRQLFPAGYRRGACRLAGLPFFS